MRVKLDQAVMYEGLETTIDELDRIGKIEWRKSDRFHGRHGIRIAYFADVKGTTWGWEVGKLAYEGRIGRNCVMCGDTGRIDAEHDCLHCTERSSRIRKGLKLDGHVEIPEWSGK